MSTERDNENRQENVQERTAQDSGFGFLTNAAVDSIAEKLRSTLPNWDRLAQQYLIKGYPLTFITEEENFGPIFELHVNTVLNKGAKASPTIDAISSSTQTENYIYEPVSDRNSVNVTRIEDGLRVTHGEFDRLLIVTDTDGSRSLLAVEAKFRKSNHQAGQKSSKAPSSFLERETLEEYIKPLAEYFAFYNQQHPESPLSGYACMLVLSRNGYRNILKSARGKSFRQAKGIITCIPLDYDSFAENARNLGNSLMRLRRSGPEQSG